MYKKVYLKLHLNVQQLRKSQHSMYSLWLVKESSIHFTAFFAFCADKSSILKNFFIFQFFFRFGFFNRLGSVPKQADKTRQQNAWCFWRLFIPRTGMLTIQVCQFILCSSASYFSVKKAVTVPICGRKLLPRDRKIQFLQSGSHWKKINLYFDFMYFFFSGNFVLNCHLLNFFMQIDLV